MRECDAMMDDACWSFVELGAAELERDALYKYNIQIVYYLRSTTEIHHVTLNPTA